MVKNVEPLLHNYDLQLLLTPSLTSKIQKDLYRQ